MSDRLEQMTPAPRVAAATRPSMAYTAPFLTFVLFMSLERVFNVPAEIGYPARCLATACAIFFFSRGLVAWQFLRPLASVGLGGLIFVIWVAPDLLFGYRGHWLFTNSLAGQPVSSLSPALRSDALFLTLRIAGSVLLVPVLEELFWRGWLMRWLTDREFWKIPLGASSVSAFWITAALFASEHGPYWEVGLIAGMLFNWWLMRTRSLADCILAHAAANGALAAYVTATGEWQYWL